MGERKEKEGKKGLCNMNDCHMTIKMGLLFPYALDVLSVHSCLPKQLLQICKGKFTGKSFTHTSRKQAISPGWVGPLVPVPQLGLK